MTNSSRWFHRIVGLPDHLQELADHFSRLTARVRAAVAEAVGETVSRAVTGLMQRSFKGQPLLEPRRPEPEDDWQTARDPWHPDEAYWPHDYPEEPEPPKAVTPKPSTLGLWAVALHGAGWWLQRKGSWLGAMGIALVFGGAAVVGGRVAMAGLGLAETVHEILSLQHALTGAAGRLGS